MSGSIESLSGQESVETQEEDEAHSPTDGTDARRPPESGILEFYLEATPVSFQRGDSAARAHLKRIVGEQFRSTGYLLSGEVQVAIDWCVPARERWETDRTPDIDAILKPLLDGLVGPESLLIDDSQVQRVNCGWLDEGRRTQGLRFEVRYSPDSWVQKHALAFIPVWESLCFPVHLDWDPAWALQAWELVKTQFAFRARGERELGISADVADYLLPAQRAFHRTRIRRPFQIIEPDVYERRLRKCLEARNSTTQG